MWDLLASIPDHCLSFYSGNNDENKKQGKTQHQMPNSNKSCRRIA